MAIRPEWIDELFRKLDGKYPRLFKTGISTSALFDTEEAAIANAKKEWTEELYQCTGPDISCALNRLSEEMPEFPPSAPMFAKMCREERVRLWREKENDEQTLKLAAPVKKVSQETVEKVEQQVKHILDNRPSNKWAFKILQRIIGGEEVVYYAETTALEAIYNTGDYDHIPMEYIAKNRPAYTYVGERMRNRATC